MKGCERTIRRLLGLLLLLLIVTPVSAQTIINADIQANTAWTLAGSPYIVTADVRIFPGVNLDVEAGVRVRFDAQTGLQVDGALSVLGNALDSVFFLANAPLPDTGAWDGIAVNGSVGGNVTVRYAKFAHASTAVSSLSPSGINVSTIQNAEFRRCGRGLAGWQGGLDVVRNCAFKENYAGAATSTLTFRRCAFAANALGLADVAADIDSCTFTKHDVAVAGGTGQIRNSLFLTNILGLQAFGQSAADSVTGCQLAENDTAAVLANPVSYLGNEFCANAVQVALATAQDIALPGNCWCSLDTNAILAACIDGRTVPGLGRLWVTPIDTSCPVLTQVWPGDINDDGVADIVDVLHLGVAYGSAGPARAEPSASWTGQAGLPWDLGFDFGPNYKHADCDGDGFVGLADTLPILQNFGDTHYKRSGISTDSGIPVIFEMPARATGGDTVQISIRLGDAQHPATGVYGLAFVLRPDTAAVQAGSLQTDLSGTWLGTPGTDLLGMDVTNDRYHFGVVRIDQQAVSGSGRMGGVIMVMIDDLTRWMQTDSAFTIDNVTLIDKKGNPIPTDVQVVLIHPCAGQSFAVCPSPAINGRMEILLDTLTADRVELYNETGLRVFLQDGPVTGSLEVDTHTFQPGLYYVRVTLPTGSVTRKVLILSQ
jgi:hypothetical protein